MFGSVWFYFAGFTVAGMFLGASLAILIRDLREQR
jgi:hypothetical protein